MDGGVILELLRRVPLFAEIPAVDLRAVAEAARMMTRKRTARIFEEGSPADSCFVLTSGRAKVVLGGRAGTDIVLGTVEPFELVGEIALIDESPRSASLVALEECHLIRITGASFRALRKSREFEGQLVVHVTSMLRRATGQLRAIYTYSSAERVSWCLARLAFRIGRREAGRIVISPRPLHQDLADMTGCSRETVSRVLLQLRRKKSVSWNAASLAIDEATLAPYVEAERGLSETGVTRFV